MFLRISFLVGFFAVVCPVMGQSLQKKPLDREDYSLWHTMYMDASSDDGSWVSCRYTRKDGNDTLVIRNTLTQATHIIPDGKDGKFGKAFFACRLPGEKAAVIGLLSGKRRIMEKVADYQALPDGKHLIVLQKASAEPSGILYIMDYKGEACDSIPGVTTHKITPDGESILFTSVQNNSIVLCRYLVRARSTAKIYRGTSPLMGLSLSADSKLCMFYEATPRATILRLLGIKGKMLSYISLGKEICIADDLPLKISNDGKRIFFGVCGDKAIAEDTAVDNPEVWLASDPQIYPMRKILEKRQWTKLCVWDISQNHFSQLSTDQLPVFSLSGSENFALLATYAPNGQDGKYYGTIDIAVRSLSSGRITVVLKDFTADEHKLSASPLRDMMAYYKDSQWWCYDMANGKTVNLTGGINAHWNNVNDPSAIQPFAYGNPAWTNDGKFLLLYDNSDIWKVACDGSSAQRLTKGKEKGIAFTIDDSCLHYRDGRYQYYSSAPALIDLSKPMLLNAKGGDNRNGLFLLEKNKEEKELIYGFFSINGLCALQEGKYIYTKENFEQSPAVVCYDSTSGKEKTLARSNPQQDKYQWGKSRCIQYKGPNGENLKAALLYPAGYVAGKKYPMVVYIYQAKSWEMNLYVNPSFNNYEGFNVTNYTAEGYIVLLPDIAYEMGDPCSSASRCLQAAVDTVIEMGIADKTKIGLIGHSFGGYQVNCILGLNNSFAVAVSGSGVSDSTGKYFSTNTQLMGTEAWRFESQQYHMEKSFYDNKQGYIRNSPIFNADSITAPLLLWAGKKDIIVLPAQSMALYHSLRRLRKECAMLLYPHEGHSLHKDNSQRDLTIKISQWFGYYLKDSPKADWMESHK